MGKKIMTVLHSKSFLIWTYGNRVTLLKLRVTTFFFGFETQHLKTFLQQYDMERSVSVVECLTRDRRAAGSSLTVVTALWSLSKTHLS